LHLLVEDEDPRREALEYAAKQVEADPEDGIFWLLKGHCHYRLGEMEEATDAYRRASELGETSSHAPFFLGSTLVEMGRLEEAIVPLLDQLEATPDHKDALFLLGLVYHVLDARDRSEIHLERVRELDPSFYEHMFAQYAEILANESPDPMIRQGLQEAARALRGKPE
jgi:superkiller protein 3